MPIKLTNLIARVPLEVKAEVRRTRDQARPVLQEAQRTECRLVFRTAEESEQKRSGAQVPIEVASGYPVILEDIAFPDDFEHIMLLARYRTSLEQARLKLKAEPISEAPGDRRAHFEAICSRGVPDPAYRREVHQAA